mgnify:CR=1 FL=1
MWHHARLSIRRAIMEEIERHGRETAAWRRELRRFRDAEKRGELYVTSCPTPDPDGECPGHSVSRSFGNPARRGRKVAR